MGDSRAAVGTEPDPPFSGLEAVFGDDLRVVRVRDAGGNFS